jgi:hypothetical protein
LCPARELGMRCYVWCGRLFGQQRGWLNPCPSEGVAAAPQEARAGKDALEGA